MRVAIVVDMVRRYGPNRAFTDDAATPLSCVVGQPLVYPEDLTAYAAALGEEEEEAGADPQQCARVVQTAVANGVQTAVANGAVFQDPDARAVQRLVAHPGIADSRVVPQAQSAAAALRRALALRECELACMLATHGRLGPTRSCAGSSRRSCARLRKWAAPCKNATATRGRGFSAR